MARLSVSVLGPLEIALDGEPSPAFEYDKVRALLVYLAVGAGQPHPRGRLAGLLWPALPEPAARRNLTQALARMRTALGDKVFAARFLRVDGDSLQLDPAAGVDVDAARFLALLDTAETHPHRSWRTCSPCAERLRQAVTLYRGDFLAHFFLPDSAPFEDWAAQWRQDLRRRCLAALERLAAWAEWRGMAGQAAEYARRQVEMEPFLEASQRALMQRLAASGQTSAALTQYDLFRRLLAQEMNAVPDAETNALYERIKAGGLLHPDDTDHLARRPHMPSPPTRLIGREADMQIMLRHMQTNRDSLVTLTGAPGIGKTRLALELAAGMRFEYEDGVCFVELAPVREASLVPAAIAQALQVKDRPGEPLTASILAALKKEHRLLVLDNFEHVPEAAAFVAELLAACPDLQLLITSRAPLGLPSEQHYPLAPLALPGTGDSLYALARVASVRLFVDRALAVQPEFALTAENAQTVARICQRLDGLPLALELIASRARTLSPAALLAQLEAGLDALNRGPRDLPERQRTLRRAIAWSYDRLGDDEQRLFAHLGVFAGGCTLEAARAVVGDADALGVGPVLDALRVSSLVQVQTAADETRHTLLETLREFALEQLEARGQLEAAQRRHADYFLALAEQAHEALIRADQARWIARLAAELDNVRAAIRWTLQSHMPEAALRIATGVFRFCWQRGLMREGLSWFEQAFNLRHDVPPAVQSHAFRAAGILAWGLSDYANARRWTEEAIHTGQRAGDADAVAMATTNLGLVLNEQGEWEMANARLAEAVTLNRFLEGDPHAIRFPLVVLGNLYVRLGKTAEAGQLFQEALDHNRQLDDVEGIAHSLYGLAIAAGSRGDYEAARALGGESLELYRSLNHQHGMGMVHYHLGNILRDAQAIGESLTHYQNSLRIWLEREDTVSAAMVLEDLSQLLAGQRQWLRLTRLLGAAAALREAAHARLTPFEEGRRKVILRAAQHALGESAFENALAEGRTLTMAQAVGLALDRAASTGKRPA